ncbi:MAG: hypothetical protein V4726_22255 [Verrucomicrobiota bacterium]
MTDRLDDDIARVTAELNKLRQQKMEELMRAMRQLEDGTDIAMPVRQASRRFTDEEVTDLLMKAVEEASSDGISALKAAEKTSIAYARVRPLMPKLFKKTGSGRNTLYIPKPKRKG